MKRPSSRRKHATDGLTLGSLHLGNASGILATLICLGPLVACGPDAAQPSGAPTPTSASSSHAATTSTAASPSAAISSGPGRAPRAVGTQDKTTPAGTASASAGTAGAPAGKAVLRAVYDAREMNLVAEAPVAMTSLRQARDALVAYSKRKFSSTGTLPADNDEAVLKTKMLGAQPGPWAIKTESDTNLLLPSATGYLLLLGASTDQSGPRANPGPVRVELTGNPSVTVVTGYSGDEADCKPAKQPGGTPTCAPGGGATLVHRTTYYDRTTGQPLVQIVIEVPGTVDTNVTFPLDQRATGVQVGGSIQQLVPFRAPARVP